VEQSISNNQLLEATRTQQKQKEEKKFEKQKDI